MARYITVFRDPQNALDWDFHISENADELRQVHHNLAARGAKTGASYVLGEKIADVPDVIKETDMALYQFDIYSEKLELIASEVMGFEEKVHARAKAGRFAKKHNGPVDVAAYDPAKDFDERYITTAYPSVHTRSGYYFERIEN